MGYILIFLTWTYIVYWMHVMVHKVPTFRRWHMDHHSQVTRGNVGWSWLNFFLWNDSLQSTLDLWITEVIPAILVSWLFDTWSLLLFYYVWAAIIQERVEHDEQFDLPILTSGKWHMQHHKDARKNFGVFVPFWDALHGTMCR